MVQRRSDPHDIRERPSARSLKAAARELGSELGSERVLSDGDALNPYGEDASFAGVFLPDIVVRAASAQDVKKVFAVATRHKIPVTPRGLGTGKAGGALAVFGGIVLSLERMNRLVEISRADMLAVAEPGIVTGDLMQAAEVESLFYPPDPNSYRSCSLGGNVACNAGGPRALKYGVTRNYVLGLSAVLPSGEELRLGSRTIKNVAGYDLVGLLVGSEGTLAVITEITCRLVPLPRFVKTALVAFDTADQAVQALTEIFRAGFLPRTLEFLDRHALMAIRDMTPSAYPARGDALLLVEVDSMSDQAAWTELERIANLCVHESALDVLVAQDERERERMWEPRRTLSTTLSKTAPHKISEDVVVPRSRLAELLRHIDGIANRTKLRVASYGHAGDGNVHVNFLFDEGERPQATRAAHALMRHAVELGGSISGEHGVGLTKRDFLSLQQTPACIALQRRLKELWDPYCLLNPGKIFPARSPTE